jgi:glutamyl-tRNA synthetase
MQDMITVRGRFAPSPTGELHLGNLRTALMAWLSARSAGGEFVVRMEDLDRVTSSPAHEQAQLRDLAAIGITWDYPVIRQSERFDLYRDAIATLQQAGRVYECYCTRREIREAASAPHAATLRYPGTCRELTRAQRAERTAAGRPAALRFAAASDEVVVTDIVLGDIRAVPDDVVLQRNDGVPAYNLAVVVDDAAQGVSEVIRGDDLADVTPSQAHLAQALGLAAPHYAHVPLVHGPDGERLAKRHGAVTLAELAALGWTPGGVLGLLARSIGLLVAGPGSADAAGHTAGAAAGDTAGDTAGGTAGAAAALIDRFDLTHHGRVVPPASDTMVDRA